MNDTETGAAPEKKSSFGCLKILIIIAAFTAVILLIIGIMVWSAISWFKDAPETKVATYAPLQLSAGEKEDVARVVPEIYAATKSGEDVDESLTPLVFNAVLEKMMEDDRRTNKTSNPPVFFRGAITANGFEVKASFPFKDPGDGKEQKGADGQYLYINVETDFNLEVENSTVTQVEIQSVKIHDRPAPFLIRAFFYHNFTESLKQGRESNQNDPNKPNLEILKTLKREGERIHFVLNGKKLKEQEERKRAAQNSNATAPKSADPAPVEKKE